MCGETHSDFDLKGQKVRIWVAEHQNAKRITSKIIKMGLLRPIKKALLHKYESYYVTPTFVSSKKYYFHLDTDRYSTFDFSEDNKIIVHVQDSPKVTVESADTFKELSRKLSNLLGYQHKLPDWIYDGAILAIQDWVKDGDKVKEGFDGCNNIDKKIQKVIDKGGKVVGVWSQDWCGCRCTGFGYQVMWNWEYNNNQYPDLPLFWLKDIKLL